MNRFFKWGSVTAFVALILGALHSCHAPTTAPPQQEPMADSLVLALDWSPNVLHAGIFWAELQGWYAEEGIALRWFSTEVDNYEKKPILRVLHGEADVAIGPSEHLFHFNDELPEARVVAIGSLLQGDQSLFCTKARAGVTRPSQLGHHTYLGYNTPMELDIWRHMLGEGGSFDHTTPGRLQVWDAFKAGAGDVVWIFSHWEGVLAKMEGLELTCFRPADCGVPYGYSSVMMAHKDSLTQSKLRRFMKATSRGYIDLQKHSTDSIAAVLAAHMQHPNFNDKMRIALALDNVRGAFTQGEMPWGFMMPERWEAWQQWMEQHRKDAYRHAAPQHYSNDLLK